MSGVRKRKAAEVQNSESVAKPVQSEEKLERRKSDEVKTNEWENRVLKNAFSVFHFLWSCFGLVCVLFICRKYSLYLETLHENDLWFSDIKEVEREISFRTEQGLYYSYYKQLVQSDDLDDGLRQLKYDKITEHGRSINVLSRFNIYPEVFLAILYKTYISTIDAPIFFYIKAVFSLNGFGLAALCLTTWFMTGSWLSTILTSFFYILNKHDATRVYFTVPLRESFALPLLFAQTLSILMLLRKLKYGGFTVSWSIFQFTFLFILCWQFSQFILLLQAFMLYILVLLRLVKFDTYARILLLFLISLLLVAILQYNQKMLIGSLVLSFIPVSVTFLYIRESVFHFLGKKTAFFTHIIGVICGTFLLNNRIRFLLEIDSDEHIFKFLKIKLLQETTTDFETKLYICNPGFNNIDVETYWRLTRNFILPLYAIHIIYVGIAGMCYLFKKDNDFNSSSVFKNLRYNWSQWIESRSDIIYLTGFSLLLGIMAFLTLRMKFIWVPFICAIAPITLSKAGLWGKLREKSTFVTVMSVIVQTLMLVITAYQLKLMISNELKDLKEFWDPDTVELMEWIRTNTSPVAAFAGSMQLLAAVKLSTSRPITNHPHFEDKWLRKRTEQVYQMYAHRSADDVYKILHNIGASYIILEDSICLAPSRNGCSLPEIMDTHNAQVYLNITQNSLLFCDAIRHMRPPFSTYFKLIFQNDTFRVYRLLNVVERQNIHTIPSYNM